VNVAAKDRALDRIAATIRDLDGVHSTRTVAREVLAEVARIVSEQDVKLRAQKRLCHEVGYLSHDGRWCGQCESLRDGVEIFAGRLLRLLRGER